MDRRVRGCHGKIGHRLPTGVERIPRYAVGATSTGRLATGQTIGQSEPFGHYIRMPRLAAQRSLRLVGGFRTRFQNNDANLLLRFDTNVSPIPYITEVLKPSLCVLGGSAFLVVVRHSCEPQPCPLEKSMCLTMHANHRIAFGQNGGFSGGEFFQALMYRCFVRKILGQADVGGMMPSF